MIGFPRSGGGSGRGRECPQRTWCEAHGGQHSKLSAILEAHGAPGYNAASDILTRTGWRDDFALGGSIYPFARDPVTGVDSSKSSHSRSS